MMRVTSSLLQTLHGYSESPQIRAIYFGMNHAINKGNMLNIKDYAWSLHREGK